MLYSVEIGMNIVKIRKEQKMSQEELAFRAKISVSRLRDIEHGKANPSIDTLESVAKALSVELLTLFLYSIDDAEIRRIHRQSQESLTGTH